MEVSNLGEEEGLETFKESTTISLIDADTIAYAAATGCEYADDILSKDMYTEEEWVAITSEPTWDETENCVWKQDLDKAIEVASDRVDAIIAATECGSAELHFSSGKNFRYDVYPMYKANRKSTRYPTDLHSIKEALVDKYGGYIHTSIEADDAVCFLKRSNPDKYVLCAIDKDVYKSVPGKHYNYYYSMKYKIQPRWVTTDVKDAEEFPYLQTLMGDTTDNIRGCPGIGPKKAAGALAKCTTNFERWEVVCKLFKQKGLTVKDAIRDMRLVNMHQVVVNEKGEWVWLPWIQPMQ